MNNKKPLLLLSGLLLTIFTSCIFYTPESDQNKEVSPEKNFTNRSEIPFIENCKDDHTTACFQNTISDLILQKVDEKGMILKQDTLQIMVRVNEDGTLSLLDNNTSNESLKKVAASVVSNITNVQPGYLEEQKRYISSGYSWFIIIEDNKLKNRLDYKDF